MLWWNYQHLLLWSLHICRLYLYWQLQWNSPNKISHLILVAPYGSMRAVPPPPSGIGSLCLWHPGALTVPKLNPCSYNLRNCSLLRFWSINFNSITQYSRLRRRIKYCTILCRLEWWTAPSKHRFASILGSRATLLSYISLLIRKPSNTLGPGPSTDF